MGSGVAARIQINGLKVVDLYNGGFSYHDLRPGSADIMVDQFMNLGEWTGTFLLESEKEYYFSVKINAERVLAAMTGSYIGGAPFILSVIDKETALEELKTLNWSGE